MEHQFLQDGTGNYLKIKGVGKETLSDRIFSFQEVKGFLPMEIHWINGQKEAVYNISGRVSLARYLSETAFTLGDIKSIFSQLADMADQLTEYLLDAGGLFIHEDFLYIEPRLGQIEGIFYPEGEKGDVKALGELLEFIIFPLGDFESKEEIRQIANERNLKVANKPDSEDICFVPDGNYRELLELIMEKMNQQDKDLVFFVYGMHRLTKEEGCTPARLWKYAKDNRSHPSPPPKERIIYPPRDEKSVRQKKERIEPALLRRYLVPVGIGLFGIGAFLFLWGMGLFRTPLSNQIDGKKALGSALFFLAVSGYGIWKALPQNRRRKKEEDEIDYQEEAEEKTVCLIPCQGKEEPIPVTCFPFRLRRAHLQILQEGEDIFAVDEESANGTYRNNERLAPWQKTRLRDGDLLRLAEKEYVVEITQSEYVI